MAAKASKSKPYPRFGRFILFKKIDSDALGEMWRAGEISDGALAGVVALRKLSGGDRGAFVAGAERAQKVLPQLSGSTIAKHQKIEIIDAIATITHEYGGGRTLRHIIDRARGGAGPNAHPQPLAIDQALAIAEKVAASLEALNSMKIDGTRLMHGGLVPHLVWINEDGDVRVAGQQLGSAFAASMKEPAFAKELAPYFAPEIRQNGEPSKASEVYAAGAILYLVISGNEPPETAPDDAVSRLKTGFTGEPFPEPVRSILQKSFTANPDARYPSVVEFREALTQLLHGGQYAPTTFNLAFYLHTLLKKEMEGEALERDKESKINIAPYVAELTPRPLPLEDPNAPPPPAPAFGGSYADSGEPKKSKLPLFAGIAAAIATVAIGAYLTLGGKNQSAPQSAVAQVTPPAAPTATMAPPAPVVTAVTGSTTADPDAKKKAIEEEITRRLQEEMMKLQEQYNEQLKQGQRPPASSTGASLQPAAATPVRQAEPVPSAAQLDERSRPQTQPAVTPPTATTAAAVPPPPPPPAAAPQVAEQPPSAAPAVKEGDLVSLADLDERPRILRKADPAYPPAAAKQKREGSVIVSALVSETGRVLEVRILRGDPSKLGFDESAMRAMRSFTFTPAVKNGKKVKTWFPQTFRFTP